MIRNKHGNEARLGAFIILVLVVLGYLCLKIGRLTVGEDIRVDAVFKDASGLVKDGAVMLAGVRVGTVTRLSVEHDQARVTMMLRSDAHVRKDARATVRMKSLLGEKFLEIIPQSKDAPLIQSGDVITSTFIPTEFDQLLNRVDTIVQRIDADDPETGNMLENLAKLTAALSKIAAESGESIPVTLRNLRDVSADLREMLAENKPGLKHTLSEVHELAATTNRILEKNETHINQIAGNLDKAVAPFAQNSEDLSKNLNVLLKNLAQATERMPKMLDDLQRISSKFETTLDIANRLLVKADAIDETMIRKFFQQDGITINLFRKKVDGQEGEEYLIAPEKEKDAKQKKGGGWFIFPK